MDALYEHKVRCGSLLLFLTFCTAETTSLLPVQVRVVILADHPLEEIFVHDVDHSHDESHVLMDDLGLKRVRVAALFLRFCTRTWSRQG